MTEIIPNESLQETKFREHKLQTNDIIIKLDDCNFKKEAETVCSCSSYLKFSKQEHQDTKEQRRKLKDANFCKFRFCAMCNWRRNINIAKELLTAFEAIEATRSVSYLFLTLTINNPPINDLKATIKLMNKAFERMSKTTAYKNTVLGHFKALELLGDKTKEGEAHPHFHILLIVSKSYFQGKTYLSQAKWVEMWQKALRVDYKPVVQIQRIKAKKKLTALQSAVFEVAKYSVKHSELTGRTNEDFTHIINQTKNMRFRATGGMLKKMINLQKCDDELIQLDKEKEALWEEIAEELYKWRDGDYLLTK